MAVKSSFKNMTLCLLAICLVCSALLAGVYALTKEPIDAAAKAKNEAAIKEVLPETAAVIEEERTVDFEGQSYAYNLAYDEKGEVVGVAINVAPNNTIPDNGFSQSEIMILQELAERREALDLRSKEIDRKAVQLKVAEDEIDKKIKQLQEYEQRLKKFL